jgi:uncharacterized protein (TIGR00299 family) protein
MRIAYIDCFSGVCGSMIIGSLVDAGVDLAWLESELSKLKISGYRLRTERTERHGIAATEFHVDADEGVPHRSAAELLGIIDRSALDPAVKTSCREILGAVARTEAKIHGRKVEEIHLHEVAGIDSIIDVVGSVLGLKRLGVETVYASRIHLGTGFVRCAHGTFPVPAPATLALLEGIPVYSTGIEAELATPTGVAILKVLAKAFGPFPAMKVERSGYGAGGLDLAIPNLLRVTLGESEDGDFQRDEVVLVETNLDDMNPEIFGHVADLLWRRGALDVYMTPVYMKKNRPGTLLSVLVPPERLDEVTGTLASETTTLGMRIARVERMKLARESRDVTTRWGTVKVKVSCIGDRVANVAPEYEDCRRIAIEHGVPLKDVYEEARETARRDL